MFSLFKPGHLRLRESLPQNLHGHYDEVLNSVSENILNHWSKGAQDRALTIVMAQWIISNARASRLAVPQSAYAKAMHFAAVCFQHNDRDYQDGASSTARALEIIEALTETGEIPED